MDDWIKAIFAREYSPNDEAELEKIIRNWVGATGDYKSLDAFYSDLMSQTVQKNAIGNDLHCYSIRNYDSGNYLNCNGIAAITAIKGKLQYDRSFKVIIDYQGGKTGTGVMEEFKSHISITDGKKNYGGRADFSSAQKLPEKSLILIYMLSEAFERWQLGKKKSARSIAQKVAKQMSKHDINSPYMTRRIKETNNNF